LHITWKKWNKEHQTLSFQFFTTIFSILMFFVLFFHVVFKISTFNKWTPKHLAKASCTELTLTKMEIFKTFQNLVFSFFLFLYLSGPPGTHDCPSGSLTGLILSVLVWSCLILSKLVWSVLILSDPLWFGMILNSFWNFIIWHIKGTFTLKEKRQTFITAFRIKYLNR
jgi:hypothetical protein